MNFFIRQALQVLAPFLIGTIANLLTEAIDKLKAMTGAWGAPQKQALAAGIAALAAAGGQLAGHQFLDPNTPLADALNNLDVNAVAGALFAYALKHGQQLKQVADAAAAPTTSPTGSK